MTTSADRRARFELLFDEHFRGVSGYARRRAAVGDADDAVAETFLLAWRRLDEVPAEARAWLLAVARRVLANQRRATERRSSLAVRVAGEPAPEAHPSIADAPILRALAELRESDRELLLLIAWDGLSTDEAAVVLGCTGAAAKVRLHRARRRLRGALDASSRPAPPPTNLKLEECHDD